MGLYGGSSPPPPPDYTEEKGAIRQQTEARYQQQADAYNAAVADYNQQLQDMQSQFGERFSQHSDLGIADLYDDPNTDQNENPYDRFSEQLSGLRSNLSNLNFNETRPSFSSSVGSEYGTVGITNIPTLDRPNEQLYGTLRSDVSSALSGLEDLQRERSREENRVNEFHKTLLADLGGYQTTANQLGIADIDRINRLESDLSRLQAERQGFSSPILDQVYPSGFSSFDETYGSLSSRIEELRNQRQAEMDRIQGFEQSLYSTADDIRSQLDSLSIADADQLAALNERLEDTRRRAGRFSSELDFDLSQELGPWGLGDAERALRELQTARENELARIQRAEQNYLQRSRGLEDMAENASIYNASNLNTIEDELRNLNTDLSGFSSELPFDFSSVQDGTLTEAEAALANLQDERERALNEILGGVTGATSGLSEIELANESAFNERRSQLNDLQRELGMFSGGRVGDIEQQLTSGLEAVDARLGELQARRAELEARAQQLQQQVQDAEYRRLNDLSGDTSSVEDLQAEIELYNAQQALDELQVIEERLQSERVRIEQDAENVAARQREAQESLLSNVSVGGVPQFRNFALADPTTAEAYAELLARVQNNEDEEEALLRQAAPGSFSRNIGVVRV